MLITYCLLMGIVVPGHCLTIEADSVVSGANALYTLIVAVGFFMILRAIAQAVDRLSVSTTGVIDSSKLCVDTLTKHADELGVEVKTTMRWVKYGTVITSSAACLAALFPWISGPLSWIFVGTKSRYDMVPEAWRPRAQRWNKLGTLLTAVLATVGFVVVPMMGWAKANKKFGPMLEMLRNFPMLTWLIDWVHDYMAGEATVDDIPDHATAFARGVPVTTSRSDFQWSTGQRDDDLSGECNSSTCGGDDCTDGECFCSCHIADEREEAAQSTASEEKLEGKGGLGSKAQQYLRKNQKIFTRSQEESYESRVERTKAAFSSDEEEEEKSDDDEPSEEHIRKWQARSKALKEFLVKAGASEVAHQAQCKADEISPEKPKSSKPISQEELQRLRDEYRRGTKAHHWVPTAVKRNSETPKSPPPPIVHLRNCRFSRCHPNSCSEECKPLRRGVAMVQEGVTVAHPDDDGEIELDLRSTVVDDEEAHVRVATMNTYWGMFVAHPKVVKLARAYLVVRNHFAVHWPKYYYAVMFFITTLSAVYMYKVRHRSGNTDEEEEVKEKDEEDVHIPEARGTRFRPNKTTTSRRGKVGRWVKGTWVPSGGTEKDIDDPEFEEELERRFGYNQGDYHEEGFKEMKEKTIKGLEELYGPHWKSVLVGSAVVGSVAGLKLAHAHHAGRFRPEAGQRVRPETGAKEDHQEPIPPATEKVANVARRWRRQSSVRVTPSEVRRWQKGKVKASLEPMEKESKFGKVRFNWKNCAASVYKLRYDGQFTSTATRVANWVVGPLHSRQGGQPSVTNVSVNSLLKREMIPIAEDLGIYYHGGTVPGPKFVLRPPKNEMVYHLGYSEGDQVEPDMSAGLCSDQGLYDAATTFGHCGGPVIAVSDGALVGFHIAGGQIANKFIPITKELAEKLTSVGPTLSGSLF